MVKVCPVFRQDAGVLHERSPRSCRLPFPAFPFFPRLWKSSSDDDQILPRSFNLASKMCLPPVFVSFPFFRFLLSFYLFSYRYTFLLVSDLTFDDGDAFSADALDRVIFTTRFSHFLRNIAVANGRRMKDKIVRRDCVRTSHYPCLSGGIRKYGGRGARFRRVDILVFAREVTRVYLLIARM